MGNVLFEGRGKVQLVTLLTVALVTDPDVVPQVTVRDGISVGVRGVAPPNFKNYLVKDLNSLLFQ